MQLAHFEPRAISARFVLKGQSMNAIAHAGNMPVDFRYQYEPRGLGHAIRSAADACAGDRYLLRPLVMELLANQQPGKGGEIQLTDAMARSLDREAMYAVVIDPLSGYDTGTPSGWIATNALMAASDPRFADEFWAAIDERGGLER